MTTLFDVAEAVLDSAAEEFRAINLASVEALQAYAENGMDIELSDDDAEKTLEVCRFWPDGEFHGSNDYFHHVETPLNEWEEAGKKRLA